MRRLIAATLVASAAFVTGATTGVAYAGSAYSATGYFSIAGRNYSNDAGIHTNHVNNHRAHASTGIDHSGGNLPSGYMGALPMRRNSSGALLCQGTYYYNDGPASGISNVGCFINNHSTYSSKGATRAWNGSGYNSYWTFLSPNQNS